MSRSYLFTVGAASLIFLAAHASAQSPSTTANAPQENVSVTIKPDAKAEADRVARERRIGARVLLISLASDARSFHDQVLRARSLARIADALWAVDPDQGRTFFRQAWEAAETAHRENKEHRSLRTEILALIARRDRTIAEEFLQKLKADQQETRVENSRPDLWALPDYSQQRLNLAKELLQLGDVERALQFADPILSYITISTLDFLTYLREKDPAVADKRFASVLANVRSNVPADANTISLLSSYIFTPRTYVTFDSSGAAESSWPVSPLPPPDVSAQLRLAFFQTATAVLLRAQPSPEQDQITSGIITKYMVMKRLLPLFEQYAPKELAAAMRGQFNALNSEMSDSVREAENERAQKEIGPDKPSVDREQPLLDQIEHAGTSEQRDDLYLRLALLALSRDDPKSREYVSAMEDSELRKHAQTWVDWSLAAKSIKNQKTETALELARTGQLSHIQRVWILTQAAKLLAKTDRDQALSLLDEATSEVRRIDGGDPDRPRGFLAVANALNVIAPTRVWEAVFDAVKAANSAENFKGEDGVLTLTVTSNSLVLKKSDIVSDFDIKGIFQVIANNDFDRAIQLARGFREESPRANATIAICESVLNGKESLDLPHQQTFRRH
jgi:hypothetical protein